MEGVVEEGEDGAAVAALSDPPLAQPGEEVNVRRGTPHGGGEASRPLRAAPSLHVQSCDVVLQVLRLGVQPLQVFGALRDLNLQVRDLPESQRETFPKTFQDRRIDDDDDEGSPVIIRQSFGDFVHF